VRAPHHVRVHEPLVSIAIPTLGRPDMLTACLDSIEQTVRAPCEVVLSMVEDDRETIARVSERPRGAFVLRTVVEPIRQGYVKAINAAFRAATGRYLLYLNDDCELQPHSVDNALHVMSTPHARDIGLLAFFHDTPVRRNVFAQIDVEERRYVVCHVRGLCYANFGLGPRELFERLGYFDERFFMYGADPDFALRIWHETDLRVEPCPGALLRHAEVSDARAEHEREHRARADNAALFAKWGLSAVTI